MDDLPPPYSPPSAGAVAPPPQVVLARAPTLLPPSYDAVTASDHQGGLAAPRLAVHQPQPQQQQHQNQTHRLFRRRLSSSSSSAEPPLSVPRPRPHSFSAASSSPPSILSRLSALKPHRSHPRTSDEEPRGPPESSSAAARTRQHVRAATASTASVEDVLAGLFREHPWRRSWGPRPKSLDAALRKAALHACDELVAALLRQGAPILFTDRYAAVKMPAGSALHAALRGAAPHLAEVITRAFWGRAYAPALDEEAVPTVEDADDDGGGDISARAAAAADEKTRSLLDARDGKGCTPLHVAAEAGATDACRILLRRGAELDAVDGVRRTPLHMAARYGRTETAELLIGQGAETSHVLPPEDSGGDDDEEGGVAQLWVGARDETLADLGSYNFISQLVGKIVAQERKQALHGEKDEGDDGDDKNQTKSPRLSTRRPSRGVGSGGRTDTLVAFSTSAPSSSSSFGRPSYVHGIGRVESARPDRDPFALALESMSLKQKGPQEPTRRDVPSFLFTPEYTVWRDGLDRLQREHRAQLERNKRAEVPPEMDESGFFHKHG